MSSCNIMVKIKTFIKFSLLSTYNVKGRIERIQFWNLKELGLDPDSGMGVALSPLQSYLQNLSEHQFPLL